LLADLLAIDLDGTLLTSARLPHPDSVSAILRAKEAGMRVVLSSGRIRPSMIPFAEPLGVLNPMICSNGGHVIGPDGKEIHVRLFDKTIFDVVLDYAEATNSHISVYTRDELLFLRETSWGEAYAKRVRSVLPRVVTPEEARQKEVLKLILIDEPPRIAAHIQAIAPHIDPEVCRMTESEAEYLEFLPTDVSKGAALAMVGAGFGIPAERTAAIGDYLNDLEMLTYAGYSAAVGNAAEATKLAADQVFGTNEEGGVGQFIDWLLVNG
jgi:Cof subfamily protein (haloacid dehalogenase superfamily)